MSRYEITRRPFEIRAWLAKLDGAPWQEGGAIFASWGIDHPDSFVSLLDGFQGREREDVVEMIIYAVVDSRMTESFDRVFDKSDASIISQIRAGIRKEAR